MSNYEGCGHARMTDYIHCPSCVLQELDSAKLQNETLTKDRDFWRLESAKLQSEVDKKDRLNCEYKAALEKVAKIPESWDKSYVEKDSDLNFAIEISKEALAEKRVDPVPIKIPTCACRCHSYPNPKGPCGCCPDGFRG